ncbi:MAG: thiol reductant ABC exporter subunit CydD [Burkholderiaceae bacterium]
MERSAGLIETGPGPTLAGRLDDAICLLHAITPLLWLPQAALLALGVSRLQSGEGLEGVLWPAAGIVLAGLVRAGLEAWTEQRLFDTARDRLSTWRNRAIAAVAARSPLDRARVPAGAAASAVAEQAEAILPWQTRYRSATWRVRILPALILLPVIWYSWAAAAVLLLAAPLIPLFMVIIGWRARAASEAQWLQLSSMNAFLLDRLRGLPTLRALGSVDLTARRLRASAEDLRQRTMRVLRIAFLSSAVLELFAALGVAMVAAYIGFHLLGYLNFGAWGRRLSLADGLFILLLAPAFFEPLRELSAVWHDRAAGIAAMDALDRLSSDGMSLPDRPESEDLKPHHRQPDLIARHALARDVVELLPDRPPDVRVQGLGFAFRGEAAVLENFALDVRPGEHVALMGGSGTGKTVLMSLLAGLLSATTGRIVIGGVTLTAKSARRLRGRMAWMGQHPHVFSGSVLFNVTLGRPGVGAAHANQAIRWAGLDQVAQAHPGVSLGEGGTGLSGGESARLTLARLACARHADLLLLDEPTAHLDSETAETVTQALLTLAQGRTLIVATHDPVLAARMNRVVQLTAPRDAPARDRQIA